MPTPDELWWEAQAGEYVLGTLRGVDRDIFEKILSADEETRSKVERWQKRLSALDVLTPDIYPPDYLLPAILKIIRNPIGKGTESSERGLPAATARPAEQVQPVRRARPALAELAELAEQAELAEKADDLALPRRPGSSRQRRLHTLWKSIAGLATAAAIGMAALLLQTVNRNVAPVNSDLRTVSIMENEQREALWVLTTQARTNQLNVVAMAPPPVGADISYQLWMVKPDNAGVEPVGLLPQQAGDSVALTPPVGTGQARLFAVSLEPKGGSPVAVPTGPVLFSGTIITLPSNNY